MEQAQILQALTIALELLEQGKFEVSGAKADRLSGGIQFVRNTKATLAAEVAAAADEAD